MSKFRGNITDRLTQEVVAKTKWYATWAKAQAACEALLNRRFDCNNLRYKITVTDPEGYVH